MLKKRSRNYVKLVKAKTKLALLASISEALKNTTMARYKINNVGKKSSGIYRYMGNN